MEEVARSSNLSTSLKKASSKLSSSNVNSIGGIGERHNVYCRLDWHWTVHLHILRGDFGF